MESQQGARSGFVVSGRALVLVVVFTLVGAACSGSGGRRAVPTPFGFTLDCPSDLIAYGTGDLLADAAGSDTPQGAVDSYIDSMRPAGVPSIEDQTDERVVFVLTDADGNRLGHLIVKKTDNGWFVVQSEQCGEDP